MNYEDFESNLVRVNEGSGVLVPAMTDAHCYILTAKHNLSDTEIVVKDSAGNLLATVAPNRCFSDADKDAAVIILDGIKSPPLSLDSQLLGHAHPVTLAGFPTIRENIANQLQSRFLDGEITRANDETFDVFCREFPAQDDIMGISGGGVFAKAGDEWILVGIEHGMAAAAGEINTQVSACRVKVFEQIIDAHKLPPALPSFFDDFKKLCLSSFQLNGTFFDENKQQTLKHLLQRFAHACFEETSITPNSLCLEFNQRLLVKNTPEYSVNNKKLWISWLELLALSLLIDGKDPSRVDMDYITQLQKKRRLIFSNSRDDWSKFLKDIVSTDMEGLDDKATVIVSNDCAAPPTKAVLDFKRLPIDISMVYSRRFDFTKATQQPTPSRLMHLDGVHVHCINNQEDQYDCTNVPETMEKIKHEYTTIIAGPDTQH